MVSTPSEPCVCFGTTRISWPATRTTPTHERARTRSRPSYDQSSSSLAPSVPPSSSAWPRSCRARIRSCSDGGPASSMSSRPHSVIVWMFTCSVGGAEVHPQCFGELAGVFEHGRADHLELGVDDPVAEELAEEGV